MSTETKKLAELLRTSEDVILKLEKRMNKISRKSDGNGWSSGGGVGI